MAKFPTFKGSSPWIGSYCIPSCITRRPLPTYQTLLKSKKLFVDIRADVQTGGRTFETHYIRSTQRSRPKKWQNGKRICCELLVKVQNCRSILGNAVFMAMAMPEQLKMPSKQNRAWLRLTRFTMERLSVCCIKRKMADQFNVIFAVAHRICCFATYIDKVCKKEHFGIGLLLHPLFLIFLNNWLQQICWFIKTVQCP